jgi:hypothetical protein
MSLGLNTESGSFTPYIKIDARAGRIFRKKNIDRGEQSDVDVTNGFKAVFDLAQVETGWALFAAGGAPVYVMGAVGDVIPPKPAADFKQAFRFNVALGVELGGGVYELASTAKAVIGSIDRLHTTYQAAPEAGQGKLPIVVMTGTDIVETKTPQGVNRNFAPIFAIVGWVDRPASMPKKHAVVSPAPHAAPPASTPATAPVSYAASNDMAFG